MLKEINPLLNAEVLHALAAMGHGDDLIVADANFHARRFYGCFAFTKGVIPPEA